MNKRRKTYLNILLILLVLAFFVTPLGYEGKVLLNKIFSFSPDITPVEERKQIEDYDWTLKDSEWKQFNFEQSKGKVVFVNFWASWRLPSLAELQSIQELYNKYQGKVDFYIITDEEREPVQEFMEEHDFTFPVTYLIIGGKSPFPTADPPRTYILGKQGQIAVAKEGIADWSNKKIYTLLDTLINQ
ncbi:TlpA disulfide reductase family protein [Zeaxanthinibacter sp. PT1]|uniref:TlpA family protein disulfide reductase n=1 Tax=Zeaxanthinibacter TaxID=561554 RepID=UPI00234BC78E|nr:TlpA disulfide reductase family protein [Zeaxanthinibacter sp. PT1]MDC6351914.1 TlpA disulfide reductase family protein [Zeaxanthinibacter sp. PT1]